jgi:hypoxanthine-guanine phosphoribosyltransferase
MIAVKSFLEVKHPKSITAVTTILKENLDFPDALHILKQESDSIFDPFYIGYGMDDENGYNRNLKTIYTI